MKTITWIKTLLITALLGAIYYPAFNWMWGRWNSEDTYYSHGPLIIIACLFFIWSKRSTLSEIKTNPSYIGIVLIVLALVFHLGGTFINLYFISACSMIILIMGVVMLMVGLSALKEVLFPIVYLLFMIPLPMVLVSNIVLKMKLFAAELATSALNKIGLEAVRDGSIINMANSYLEVEAPCSGLRSLIALMAFGAAFAYLTNNSLWKKWLLFLSALPIAIAANVMRIVLLGWVSDVYGMKAAQGWVHDFSGFLLFAVAALGMLAMNGLLTTQKSLLEDKNEG